jgi:hypothetical protein
MEIGLLDFLECWFFVGLNGDEYGRLVKEYKLLIKLKMTSYTKQGKPRISNNWERCAPSEGKSNIKGKNAESYCTRGSGVDSGACLVCTKCYLIL